jgi:hypothetical protein
MPTRRFVADTAFPKRNWHANEMNASNRHDSNGLAIFSFRTRIYRRFILVQRCCILNRFIFSCIERAVEFSYHAVLKGVRR